jgi:hypothetical protein
MNEQPDVLLLMLQKAFPDPEFRCAVMYSIASPGRQARVAHVLSGYQITSSLDDVIDTAVSSTRILEEHVRQMQRSMWDKLALIGQNPTVNLRTGRWNEESCGSILLGKHTVTMRHSLPPAEVDIPSAAVCALLQLLDLQVSYRQGGFDGLCVWVTKVDRWTHQIPVEFLRAPMSEWQALFSVLPQLQATQA